MIAALVAAPAVLAAEGSSGGVSSWVSLLVGSLVAIFGGGGIYQLLTVRNNKRQLMAGTDKIRMEAADLLADSAVAMLAPLRDELVRVNAKADSLSAKVDVLETTLNRERATSETRIRQLEDDIAARERTLAVKNAEIIELRAHIKGSTGWPGGA